MSIFDPHALYKRRQHSTKKGQIIQKRPVEKRSAYTQDDLKKALEVIGAFPTSKIGRTLNFNCVTMNSGFFVFSGVILNDNTIYLTVNNILDNINASDQLWSQMSDYYDSSRGNIGPFQIVVLIRHLAYKIGINFVQQLGQAHEIHSVVDFPGANYASTFDASGSLSEGLGDTVYASFWKNSTTQLTMEKQENPAQGSSWVAVSVINQGTLDKTGSVNYSVSTTTESTRSAFLEFLTNHQVPEDANDRLVTVTYANEAAATAGVTGEVRFEIAYDVIVEGSMTI